MNRFVGLLLIAFIAVMVLVFISNPHYLEEIWMWIVGFIGYVILLAENGYKSIKGLFKTDPKKSEPSSKPTFASDITGPEEHKNLSEEIGKIVENQVATEAMLSAADVTVLRYLDDGDTTLGLIFLERKFFCYTLEDTHEDEKISGNTRIPEGTYPLKLNRNLTDLTKRYRDRFPWFQFHIEIKEIPNYSLVYIHIGNTHKDTRGCILVADGVNTASADKMVTHSQRAFERLYKILYPKLAANQDLNIQILDESWFERTRLVQKKEIVNV